MTDDLATTLLDAARAAAARAYAPYSGYRVGAALRSVEGGLHVGCNVENAAYPVGICAEAGAIAAMVAAGGTAIDAMVVVGPGPALVAPCGACRQRLREFARDDVAILLAGPDGIGRSVTVAALLPFAFGPEHLSAAALPPRPET